MEENTLTLRDLRKQSGRTVNEIAKTLSLRQQTFYRYETGERQLPLALVFSLANLYEVSVCELVQAAINSYQSAR